MKLNFKEKINKYLPDKKAKVMAAGFLGCLVISVIGMISIKIINSNKPLTADELLTKYIENQKQDIPSKQEMTADIMTDAGKISLALNNERDSDTTHMYVNYVQPVQKSTEIYADKVDRQTGVYLKAGESKWLFELKPKQSAVDDPRTEYIEVSQNTGISKSAFTDFVKQDTSDIDNTILCTAQIQGYTMLDFLENNYQALYINYDSFASYFAKYNENITLNCFMYFDKFTNKLLQIRFKAEEDAFKEANNVSTGIMIKSLDIMLKNINYDESNIYVSENIEKNTTTVKTIQSDDLYSIQAAYKNINFKYIFEQSIDVPADKLSEYPDAKAYTDSNNKVKYRYTQYVLSDNAYEIENGIILNSEVKQEDVNGFTVNCMQTAETTEDMYYIITDELLAQLNIKNISILSGNKKVAVYKTDFYKIIANTETK